MAKIKSESYKYITIKETEYLQLVENTMIVEALKIAGVEQLPIYQAVPLTVDEKIDLLEAVPDIRFKFVLSIYFSLSATYMLRFEK